MHSRILDMWPLAVLPAYCSHPLSFENKTNCLIIDHMQIFDSLVIILKVVIGLCSSHQHWITKRIWLFSKKKNVYDIVIVTLTSDWPYPLHHCWPASQMQNFGFGTISLSCDWACPPHRHWSTDGWHVDLWLVTITLRCDWHCPPHQHWLIDNMHFISHQHYRQ